MVVEVLDNPESVLVTLTHRNVISLVISVCQIVNVVIGHTEDISNVNDTGLGEHSGQQMVSWKLKDIFDDMSQSQLAINSSKPSLELSFLGCDKRMSLM
jgi:hypothetical protein